MGLLVGLALLLHREHGVRLLPHRLAQAIGALQPQPLQITVGPADQVLPPLLSAGQANLAPVSSGETMIAPDTDHRCLDQAHGVFDKGSSYPECKTAQQKSSRIRGLARGQSALLHPGRGRFRTRLRFRS